MLDFIFGVSHEMGHELGHEITHKFTHELPGEGERIENELTAQDAEWISGALFASFREAFFKTVSMESRLVRETAQEIMRAGGVAPTAMAAAASTVASPVEAWWLGLLRVLLRVGATEEPAIGLTGPDAPAEGIPVIDVDQLANLVADAFRKRGITADQVAQFLASEAPDEGEEPDANEAQSLQLIFRVATTTLESTGIEAVDTESFTEILRAARRRLDESAKTETIAPGVIEAVARALHQQGITAADLAWVLT